MYVQLEKKEHERNGKTIFLVQRGHFNDLTHVKSKLYGQTFHWWFSKNETICSNPYIHSSV